ncbi:MAG TPA: hypothetical protein VFQ65_15155 [Kofleriaceae bacterium]|nr:hypothetical protein [Kofleriaceae bacterium]
MRIASSVTVLLLIAAGCGNKSSAGGDDAGNGGDGANGSDDGGNHGGQTPTHVTLTMHHQPTHPSQFSYLVAYQDGSGPWALAPAPSGETYTLSIYAPVYAVAWTCISAGVQSNSTLRQVSELQFAVAERTSLTVEVPPRCSDAIQTVNLHGTIANTGIATSYVVKWGDRTGIVNQQDQYAMQVAPGTHDLFVFAGSSFSTGGDLVATDAIVQRNVTVTAATQVDLDGNDEESVQSFAVNNLFGGTKQTASTTLYANGTTAALVTDSSIPFENESLAADQMASGDVYDQQMTVTSIGSIASASSATATPSDETWTEVPALGTVTATSTMAPNPRVTSSWTHYPNAVGYAWGGSQTPINSGQGNGCGGNGTCTIVWSALLSAGVIGDQGTYTMPDLSALPGWNPALQMVAGSKVGGGVQAMTSTAAGDFPALLPPTVGTKRTFATGEFSVTP